MSRKNRTIEELVGNCRSRSWRGDFVRVAAIAFTALTLAGAAFMISLLLFRPGMLLLPAGVEGWNFGLYRYFTLGLAIVAAAAVLSGLIGALVLRKSSTVLAKRFDDAFELSDHVSSALELSECDRTFARAVYRRADARAEGKYPNEVFPIRIPKLLAFAVPALLFLFLVPFLAGKQALPPDYSSQAARDAGRYLRDFARECERTSESEEQKKIAKKLRDLAKELERKKMSRRDALAKLAKAISQLKAKAKSMKPTGINLERAAEELARSKEMRPAARKMKYSQVKAAAKEIGKAAEGIRRRRLLTENADFEKMAEAFDRAKRYLGRLTRRAKEVSKASANYDRDKTAEELNRFARELQEVAEQVSLEDMLERSLRELADLERSLGEMSDEELARLGELDGENPGDFFREGSGRAG